MSHSTTNLSIEGTSPMQLRFIAAALHVKRWGGVALNTVPDPLTQAVADFASLGKVRQRKMFGGVYIYCDDLFIATVHDAKLYFKANANTAPDFVARGLPIFSDPKQATP